MKATMSVWQGRQTFSVIGRYLPGRYLAAPIRNRARQGKAGRQGSSDRAGRPGNKTWEILGYGFQDMVFRTWDLNFGTWIFTLAVSKIET